MEHKFNVVVISVSGECTVCHKLIDSRKAMSLSEMNAYHPKALREVKLETAYADFMQHKCEP